MKPHYCYQTPATSPVGNLLQDFINRCNDVAEIARQWAEDHGATSYIESPDGMAGGIAALEFELEGGASAPSPDGFTRIDDPHGNVFFLPEEDSDLEKEMYNLPIVSEGELIRILRFKPRMNSKGKPIPITFGDQTPIVFLYGDRWYVDVPYECLAEGLEPITYNRFSRRLSAAQRS